MGYKQGGKYFGLKYSGQGVINSLTLPIAFSAPLFATAISDSKNDDIIPHIYAMSTVQIDVSMDLADSAKSTPNVYLLAIGI